MQFVLCRFSIKILSLTKFFIMNKTAIFIGSIIAISAFGIGIYGHNKGWFNKNKKHPNNSSEKSNVLSQDKNKKHPNNSSEKSNVLSQDEANKIANDVFVFVENYVSKNGGLDKFALSTRDPMLQPLYKGGYKYDKGKAIKK